MASGVSFLFRVDEAAFSQNSGQWVAGFDASQHADAFGPSGLSAGADEFQPGATRGFTAALGLASAGSLDLT